MFSVLNGLARREGVTGLYKGVGPTLLGIFPYAGLKFFVYQYLKGLYVQSKIEEHQQQQQEEGDNTIHLHLAPDQIHIGTHMKLCFGACAGLIAQTVTYPLDVVRRRMQVQDLMLAGGAKASTNSNSNRKNGMEVHIRNSWHGLRTIYSTMGIRKGLYAGLSLNYLKVVPSTAIGFAVYDSAKEYLNHKTSI
jgi:solute carrier family 25 protein 16